MLDLRAFVPLPAAALLLFATCLACSDSTDPSRPSPGSDADASDAASDHDPIGAALGFGRCCGKSEDCASMLCASVDYGPYFCTQTCQPYPDDCPVAYRCEQTIFQCIPTNFDSYACQP